MLKWQGSAGVRVKWVSMRPCRGKLESDTALEMAIGPWLSRAHGWHRLAVGSWNLALLVASVGQGLKARGLMWSPGTWAGSVTLGQKFLKG